MTVDRLWMIVFFAIVSILMLIYRLIETRDWIIQTREHLIVLQKQVAEGHEQLQKLIKIHGGVPK